MKNNFKWHKEQLNGKWYSVCDHKHVPILMIVFHIILIEIRSSCYATILMIIVQNSAKKLSTDSLQFIRTIRKAMLLINL